ncbi:hypothetical protein CK203_052689 [Vitis vinifera]|uniref:Uncharacterized protein n=1 Tax=Vitis vinifera TaxID=29760 RepID=A0A438GCK5_VITVI|nr:hypothetical protein CK203_052689 [Vitis vinifera]
MASLAINVASRICLSSTKAFWEEDTTLLTTFFSLLARTLARILNNLEPVVYSRKKVLGRSKDQPIIPAHGQPKALGNGSLNVLGNPPIPTDIHASSSSVTDLSLPSHFGPSPEISALKPGLRLAPIVPAQDLDLDLPIALRKGTRAYTKHPIAKYISYSNLSDNYRAFTPNFQSLWYLEIFKKH